MVVLGAALAVLAGCGTETADETTDAATGTASATATASGWTLAAPIRIDGIRTADGGRSLVVEAEVPDGERDCVRGLRGELDTVEHGTVYVKVTYPLHLVLVRASSRRHGHPPSTRAGRNAAENGARVR
ncbi:hypothetical protein PV396_04840 [Streptomyces sp. ME02-8801-2C]|uniref:hypothetical protein n=1 Tax=Streptomyces sp. ME02-8801-2C TaxID=3028680 RepID=UPI0029A4F109|nr:hypothetical protein [Streptomyces sp. ME02-8801-2C]MDX3451280.1 hypothetical protein [Streptomyces sp. ME02-8801-2C]